MLWRLSRKEFESQKGDTNKLAMKTIVAAGEVPGILVYHNSEAIGWCALAPRSRYPALLRSRILQPVDDQQCWSIACLFIKKPFRKKGVSTDTFTRRSCTCKIARCRFVDSTVPNSHPFRKRVYFNDAEGNDWEFVEYLSQGPLERNDYEL